jgi:hypothetical protein
MEKMLIYVVYYLRALLAQSFPLNNASQATSDSTFESNFQNITILQDLG